MKSEEFSSKSVKIDYGKNTAHNVSGRVVRQGCSLSYLLLGCINENLARRKDTSPWWVGPVPQFWGKPRTFLNPSSCFCHGADPIDGHRKVVGQDQYPALGEVRETAKLLPRGESPWWRDEGRHLLILCLFSIRGMRLAHMITRKAESMRIRVERHVQFSNCAIKKKQMKILALMKGFIRGRDMPGCPS